MGQPREWSGDIAARFSHWVEQFYEENLNQIFGPAISDCGKEQLLPKLERWALQRAAEQLSSREIDQFLAGVAEERRFDDVQQFCGQIVECQRLWSILTEYCWSRFTECGEGDGSNSAVGKAPEDLFCPMARSPTDRCPSPIAAGGSAQDGADSAGAPGRYSRRPAGGPLHAPSRRIRRLRQTGHGVEEAGGLAPE